jgi:predicted RND superfamily exporter protein
LSSKVQIIQTSQFVELVAVPAAQSTNIDFDIIIENEITLQNYCEALVNKVFNLNQSQFTDFINYQSNKVDDALVWLNKFEKLISNNEELFTSKCAFTRISKLINLIEQKRKEMQSIRVEEPKNKTPKKYINAESEDRHFSFYEVKKQLEKFSDDNQICLSV